MVRSVRLLATSILLSSVSLFAAAQSDGPPARTFYAVADLQQSGIGPVLIGGRPARSADYPASFYSTNGEGNCTSTMVGSRTLLTAAHCVADGGRVQLVYGGSTFSATCTHAPGYASNETADWALCLLTRDMTGVPFERINTDASRVHVGAELLLTGFGCTKPPGTGGNDGIYRIGEAQVSRGPSGESNDIVTVGEAALCFGDSGGPAFLFTDANKRGRVVVSVNSRGNIKNTSYLSSVTTAPAKVFITTWAESKKVRLCGIHSDAQNCRPVN